MRVSPKLLLGAGVMALLVGTATYFSLPVVGRGAVLKSAPRMMEYLTPSILVEGLYPSMLGPSNTDLNLRLTEDNGRAELLWITGYRADMVGPDGNEPRSQDFMCHNSLSIRATLANHARVMGSGYHGTRRLFSLSQGQSSMDLPDGFGIPISSAERLMLQSQLLNLRKERIGSQVRHRVRAEFTPDKELKGPMQALSLIYFGIELEILDEQARQMPNNPLSCAPDAGGQRTWHKDGRDLTGHWVVHPGEETRRTRLVKPFPFDTTLHYIAVHLHAYGEWLELRDLTTDQTVYKAYGRPTKEGDGLAEVDIYSSQQGLKVYADHEYEIVSYYNNTSKEDVTAMAYMFCYAKDPTFKKPDPTDLALRSEEFCTEAPANYKPIAKPAVGKLKVE